MEKNNIAAYIITESVSEPINMGQVEECKHNGLHYLRFPAVLQRFNVKNRNGRDYGVKAMSEGLHAENIDELLREGSWFGEAGHPIGAKMDRILTIDPTNTSHRITGFDIRGDMLHGTIETLDNNGEGNRMTKMMLQGMTPAFSLRALAQLIKKPDGTSLIRQRPRIVTYDWVIFPSHKEAYGDKTQTIKQVHQTTGTLGQNVNESAIAVTEAQILNFIKDESKNLKLTSDICEVALTDMKLTSDGSHVIVKEGVETYAIAVEDHINQQVRSFMSRL